MTTFRSDNNYPAKAGFLISGEVMTTSFTITVHGKDLDQNLIAVLTAAGVIWQDAILCATTKDVESRDAVISTLVANGFNVQSSFMQGRGWKVITTGAGDGV